MSFRKIIIVASTSGSVMNELLKNSFFKKNIFSVVSDRQCSAIDKAKQHQINTQVFDEKNIHIFCESLVKYLEENDIDYVISFFTKLFVGEILEKYKNRIINLHPSLLPAFKGLNGFDDGIIYGVKYIGTTIHFIDEKMDEGKIIAQTIYPVNPNESLNLIRHKMFEQQCKSLLQVIYWLTEERIFIDDNKVIVKNTSFNNFEYSPSLDFSDAIELNIPFPFKEKNLAQQPQ